MLKWKRNIHLWIERAPIRASFFFFVTYLLTEWQKKRIHIIRKTKYKKRSDLGVKIISSSTTFRFWIFGQWLWADIVLNPWHQQRENTTVNTIRTEQKKQKQTKIKIRSHYETAQPARVKIILRYYYLFERVKTHQPKKKTKSNSQYNCNYFTHTAKEK